MTARPCPAGVQAHDAAVISIDRLRALAAILSDEQGAAQFASFDLPGQVAIFGLFEDLLAEVRAALTVPACEGGSAGRVAGERP